MHHLLWIAPETEGTFDSQYALLEKGLADRFQLSVWRKPGSIHSILSQLPRHPDFILILNDLGVRMSPKVKGLASCGIPAGLFVNDVHRFIEERRHFIRKNQIPYLFSITKEPFIRTYPEFQNKLQWMPHFVDTEIYKDYGLKKDIDMLLMGAVSDAYPLRQKIISAYQNHSSFVYHPHPGYSREGIDQMFFTNQTYARELNRAKLFFTCPSIFKYPVMKYYEALACKTLLLAPSFPELEALGFIPDVHFIPIDESNFQKQAVHYLKDEHSRKRITEQGYEFVRDRHSAALRIKQLGEKIEFLSKKG